MKFLQIKHGVKISAPALISLSSSPIIFVESACGERDVVVTMTVWCVWVCACVCACVNLSVRICRTITSTIVDGFQNTMTYLFSIMCRYAARNLCSGRPKVKVTLEGQIFVRTITTTILTHLFSLMSIGAI